MFNLSFHQLLGPAFLSLVLSVFPGTPPEEHLQKVVLAQNLTEPIKLSVAQDGRVFFAERIGTVKCWHPTSGEVTILGALPRYSGVENGLLAIALDPGFATNHWIYLYHSVPKTLENRLSRFTLVGETLDRASEKIVIRIPTEAKSVNHAGGGLNFDAHGNLYLSTGDNTIVGGSDGFAPIDERPGRELWDSQRTAANSNELRGKILRIHPEPDGTYTIPDGNLFRRDEPRTRPEIYLMGVRNPFRFTIDPATGWLLFGDVGPDAVAPNPERGPAGFDEFNIAQKPGNFGWPYFVADNRPYRRYNFATGQSGPPFDPAHPVNDSRNNTGIHDLPPAQPALIWYPPGYSTRFPMLASGGRSAMAGPIYHFDAHLVSQRKLPAPYDGVWFIFDWERSWLKAVRLHPDGSLKSIQNFMPQQSFRRPICLELGPDGALYLLEWGTNWANNKDAKLVRIEAESKNF